MGTQGRAAAQPARGAVAAWHTRPWLVAHMHPRPSPLTSYAAASCAAWLPGPTHSCCGSVTTVKRASPDAQAPATSAHSTSVAAGWRAHHMPW